ncbi:hypothetical protein HMPREF1548_06620 [Clostridium sp. KLE 1755]|nr:hypothetical protein HMPREF1548_06620 [Clostridium sp. KLE 1755]
MKESRWQKKMAHFHKLSEKAFVPPTKRRRNGDFYVKNFFTVRYYHSIYLMLFL